MKKVVFKILNGFKWFFICLIIFVLLVISSLNGVKYFIYNEYYSNKAILCEIPDINNGFVPQGLTYSEEEELILQSGYIGGSNHCVIYLTDKDNVTKRLNVANKDGSLYEGHFGGITINGDVVYVCEDHYLNERETLRGRVYTFSLKTLMSTDHNDKIFIDGYVNVDADGSCISYYEGYLYVGEYYGKGSYETVLDHRIVTPNNDNNTSIVSVYKVDENDKTKFGEYPEYQISLPENVQGIALKDDTIVISQSAGIGSSKMGYYSINKTGNLTSSSSGREVPLYYIDSSTKYKEVTMPAMSEGIFIKDNRVHVSFESACNKYIFGKLFNAFDVVSIPYYQSK